MKYVVFVLTCAFLAMLIYGSVYGASEVVLDQVSPVFYGDTVLAGCTAEFTFRIVNTDGNVIRGFTNGFRVWTQRNGAYTNNFDPITYDTLPIGWISMFMSWVYMAPFGVDGIAEDTIGFGGYASSSKPGIPDGFDERVWWVRACPYIDGDTLCIDSSWFPPGGEWLWNTSQKDYVSPDWYGPYCFHVYWCPCGLPQFTNCISTLVFPTSGVAQYTFCAEEPIVPPAYGFTFRLLSGPGMLNQVDDSCTEWSYTPTPADAGTSQSITLEARDDFNCGRCTVELIFTDCWSRGNVDNIGGINVADEVYLIDFLFFEGPAPPFLENGNVDGVGGINVTDDVYLVNYLFFGGPAPPPCP